tara:strand:- start:627 stop:1031 length:405 start_codon:yes stop_codon:yes gene_type:complete
MDNFYTIVIVIAIILLIGILTYIGMLMNDSSGSEVYPPSSTTCPDYWEIDSSGKCKIPEESKIPGKSAKNRGTLFSEAGRFLANSSTTPGLESDTNIDFNDDGWNKSGNSVCAKKHWANTYGIVWDGISNYNDC